MNFDEQVKEFDNMIPIQKIRAVAALKNQDEESKKLNSIYEEHRKHHDIIINITNINDQFQIVEHETKFKDEKRVYFAIYINFKNTHYMAESFDTALLQALCLKYDNNPGAAEYIRRMLGMPLAEEKREG